MRKLLPTPLKLLTAALLVSCSLPHAHGQAALYLGDHPELILSSSQSSDVVR